MDLKILPLILLFHASLQLQCDKTKITARIRGEFILSCSYDTSRYLYSKKYWCRGDSKSTCGILADSEPFGKSSQRFKIVDARKIGLFVKGTNLQYDDSGLYWIGIDKIYADIMTSIDVSVTDAPVSKPRLWPLSSLVGGPTCWGQRVTVRCGCTEGSSIRYAWHQRTNNHEDLHLHSSSDLHLDCTTVEKDSGYYCTASNDISKQESDILSVQVLMPADVDCIYVIKMQGQPIYDCAGRMSTTVAPTPTPTTCQAPTEDATHTDTGNQSSQSNQAHHNLFFNRAWTGVPLWYALLRWASFALLLICPCIVVKCAKRRRRRCTKKKKKRKVYFKQLPHSAE